MTPEATKAELIRLAGWVDYLNQERETHMAKIEDLNTKLAQLSEAVLAHTVEAARALDDERQQHEAQIDSAVAKVTELYETLTARDHEPTAEPAPEPETTFTPPPGEA